MIRRFVSVLQVYQLHVCTENLARYGARKLIDPKVTAETWCIHEKQTIFRHQEGHLSSAPMTRFMRIYLQVLCTCQIIQSKIYSIIYRKSSGELIVSQIKPV